MIILKYIEINVEVHNAEDHYYKSYERHMFFTTKKYTHDKLVYIMKNIDTKYIEDRDNFCTEIDYKDLVEKLGNYGINELVTPEKYYFDSEEEEE
jgi:hypothetical protein